MEVGQIFEVRIEKVTNNGLGLAKINNFVVFVDNACTQDYVKIIINKINKNYASASIKEILDPSPYRVTPFCPMQKVCGACQLQYIDYDYQLEIKRQITQDAIKKIGSLDIEIPLPIPSPEIKNYRHKIQYPISQTKNSKKIIAGYYKTNTHEIVNIKYCPIQPEICDRIIDYIREKAPNFGISGYEENLHRGTLRHVVIRNSASSKQNLLTLVVNTTKSSSALRKFSKAIFDEFEEVVGVCINYNSKKTNVIMGDKTECICGLNYIEEKILDKTFLIGADTFFQVNPKSAENLFQYTKNYIEQNFNKPLVLDAYAGISAFGICLSKVANKIICIEENLESVKRAKQCVELNNIDNLEVNGGDAGIFFTKQKQKFDVIILDPPRKGCTQQSLDETLRLCKNTIIYVSCNPATLARDLKYLKQKGCTIKSIQPFDMFCHTYHIENVAIVEV